MPGRDGTGPRGRGPMTGRGMGFCVLKVDPHRLGLVRGFAGVDGKRVETTRKEGSALIPPSRDYDGYLAREVSKMPGGDGTGPGGMGPMTGRAAGYCAGYPAPGYVNPIGGRGLGFGRGRGFGRGLGLGFRGGRGAGFGGYPAAPYGAYGYAAPFGAPPVPYGATGGVPYAAGPTSRQELGALKGQSEYLEGALEGIKKRIVELEASTEEKE